MTLNAKIGGFTDFSRDIGLRKFISFTRRRHRRQRHTRLWPMSIMVPMGRVQVICDFRNYNYWTGNAIGFRASRELCSNFLLFIYTCQRAPDGTTGFAQPYWLKIANFKFFHPFSFCALAVGDLFRIYGEVLRILKLESSRQPIVKIWWS